MRYSKWIGLAAAALLVISCFAPWIFIESKNLVITGTDTSGTQYGKPAYFHFLLAGLFVACSFIQRVWAKRLNLLVTALNLAWAIRNYFVISSCMMGDCPEKKSGLYGILAAAILMLITALLPDMKLENGKRK